MHSSRNPYNRSPSTSPQHSLPKQRRPTRRDRRIAALRLKAVLNEEEKEYVEVQDDFSGLFLSNHDEDRHYASKPLACSSPLIVVVGGQQCRYHPGIDWRLGHRKAKKKDFETFARESFGISPSLYPA